MQRSLAVWLWFLVAALPVAAAGQLPRAAAVRALSRQKFAWMEQRDTVALAAVLAPALRYIHSNGWTETRADVLRDLADSVLVYHSVAVVWDTAVLYDRHTVVVTGQGLFDVSLRGARGQFPLLYTEVYVRKGRRHWLLVQRHACRKP